MIDFTVRPRNYAWQVLPLFAPGTKAAGLEAINDGATLLLFGGAQRGVLTDEIYKLENNVWTTLQGQILPVKKVLF